MRINPDQGTQPLAESGRSGPQSAAAANNAAASQSSVGGDQAQLSGAYSQAAELAAQVLKLPEVQQERVQALRQAVESGSYAPDPEAVAGAMLNQWTLEPAA